VDGVSPPNAFVLPFAAIDLTIGDNMTREPATTNCSSFRFKVGEQYETQCGDVVTVLGRTDLPGYECLVCSDGKHRYDRSSHASDAGRVTGTAHDYSCPDNFKLSVNLPCGDLVYSAILARSEQLKREPT